MFSAKSTTDKIRDRKSFNLRLDDSLREEILTRAKNENMSINNYLESFLKQSLESDNLKLVKRERKRKQLSKPSESWNLFARKWNELNWSKSEN